MALWRLGPRPVFATHLLIDEAGQDLIECSLLVAFVNVKQRRVIFRQRPERRPSLVVGE